MRRHVSSGCKAIATNSTPLPLCYGVIVVAKRRRGARRAAPSVKAAPPAAAPTAEALLLALARDVTARTADVQTIVDVMATAYAPDAPLAAALREDWMHARADKTAGLALGWAREQVRLALVDVLQRARSRDPETLAWLWLAACEALAYEAATAVPDRVHALTAFLTAGTR
jgi:hypothetical protein